MRGRVQLVAKDRDHGAHGACQVRQSGAADVEHRERRRGQHNRGAVVRLQADQQAGGSDHQQYGQKTGEKPVHDVLAPGQPAGQKDHQGDLDPFRGLNRHGEQVHRARRAADGHADSGYEHERQEHQADGDQDRGPLLQMLVIQAGEEDQDDDAEDQANQVTFHEEPTVPGEHLRGNG